MENILAAGCGVGTQIDGLEGHCNGQEGEKGE